MCKGLTVTPGRKVFCTWVEAILAPCSISKGICSRGGNSSSFNRGKSYPTSRLILIHKSPEFILLYAFASRDGPFNLVQNLSLKVPRLYRVVPVPPIAGYD